MTRTEAIKYAEDKKATLQSRMGATKSLYGDYAIYSTELDFISAALNALRTQRDTQPNVPLTLEELREMDGEPVWVSFGENAWHVFIQRKTCDGILTYENNFLWFASYGKTWLAYRRRKDS